MNRGRKPEPPSTKLSRGTYRPDRDDGRVELIDGSGLPAQPDWLTAAGHEVWLDNVGRVGSGRVVTERDSTLFGNFCNLQGALILAWRAGDVPPAAYLAEARRMGELFGIAGAAEGV
jgi:hypothetical protein